MAAKELDFAKILFTGVKRKKPTSNLTASDSSELRIRLLPEAEEVQLKKPKKVEEPDEDNDENIKIFSSSASEKHLKQTEKKPERDIEAENRIQKVSFIQIFVSYIFKNFRFQRYDDLTEFLFGVKIFLTHSLSFRTSNFRPCVYKI